MRARWLLRAVAAASVAAGLVGCGAAGGGGHPGTGGSVTASGAPGAATPGAGAPGTAAAGTTAPVWLSALTMVSPSTGWALRWTANPASRTDGAVLAPVRTTDGGHTWADVTPPAARSLLTPTRTTVALLAAGAGRAWFAVSRDRANSPVTTVVFTTSDAGRTWRASAPFRSLGGPEYMRAAGAGHGWLVTDLGSAMNRQGVAVFATSDGGTRWSLVSRTPASPGDGHPPAGMIPSECAKTGIDFVSVRTGWITGSCAAGTPVVDVTHDGGRTWAPQALPGTGGACTGGSLALPPRFFGATGYLALSCFPHPALLVSHDTGAAWSPVALPPEAGAFPVVQFVSARDGFLVPGGTQGSLGGVVYRTTDGGRTWQAARPAHPFRRGTSLDFVSATAGFAWVLPGTDVAPGAPPLCRTLDAGRTWDCFTPRMAATG